MLRNFVKLMIFYGATLMTPIMAHAEPNASEKTAYDFSFTSLDGGDMPLSGYKGKVLLVVNTASKCGLTPQYKGLEALYNQYKDQGLVIIGVPSNDFGEQEPGSAAEIKKFCELNFGVTFPLTSKQVVTGKEAHPFYQWAYSVLGFGSAPKWNFHKYLVNTDGKLVDYFASTTTPDSDKLKDAIEKLLPNHK